MSDMLSIAASGVQAFQSALSTTSNNISNSSTTGYSRETANLVTNTPEFVGGSWQGTGVNAASIQRAYDNIVASQVRTSSSNMNQSSAYSSMASQINTMFSNSSSALPATLQNFMSAFQGVANSPTTSPERQVVVSQAQSLVSQIQSYNTSLNNIDAQVESQLSTEATTISGLASNIATLNAQITTATTRGSSPPNNLLDQRDTLIDQLSTHLNVTTTTQSDGSVNISVGNGQSLVVGNVASKMVATSDPYNPSRVALSLQVMSGTTDVTSSLTGGTVGGLLNFRSQMLDPSINQLGQVAIAVANTINSQQNSGMDLNGSLGANMFSVGGVQVMANANNTGTGSASVARANDSALTTSNYILTLTSSGWSLQRTDTGQSVTMSGAGNALSPFTADGMSIVVSGAAKVGDHFMIQPTSGAAASMNVTMTDPNGIAAAAPIVGAANSSNSGNATITQGVVVNATNSQLQTPVTIQFLSPTTYTPDGGTTTVNYVSGQPITMNGWQVNISGTPVTGDTFTVTSNTTGSGDNRNALLMANSLNQKVLNQGTTSINGAVGQWVASVGTQTNQAQANLTTQTAVYQDNVNTQQSISGVNLDEEAANLVRYQQAYSAAAQIIASSQATFTSLLTAVQTA